jgi:hypothetical protein
MGDGITTLAASRTESSVMADEIPRHIRPIAFGLAGLLYDLITFMRKVYGEDLESALIMICVADATLQKFMSVAGPDSDLMRRERIEDSARGSISRRMIADKTGLPRETVRRKVAQLIACNYLYIDADGAVRATPRAHDPEVQQAVLDAHAAIKRYVDVVGRYGVTVTGD